MSRRTLWVIESDDQDLTYTLKKRDHVVLEEVPLARAMQYLRSKRQSGEPVHRVFPGGHIVDITKRFKDETPKVANPRRIRFGFSLFRH